MGLRKAATAGALVLLVTIVAGSEKPPAPPAPVLEHLDAAVLPEDPSYIGSWHSHIHSIIEKPNGKAHHEAVIDVAASRDPGGTVTRTLIRFIRDGQDRTEDNRHAIEHPEDSGKKRKKKHSSRTLQGDFRVLGPDTVQKYRFEPLATPPRDGLAHVRFAPLPAHRKDPGLMTGELSWDPITLDPIHLQGTLVHPPGPLKELHVALTYERTHGVLVIRAISTHGLARFLFLKRRFRIDSEFSNIVPAPRGDSQGSR